MILATMMAFAFAAPAFAQYNDANSITVSDTTLTPGQSVTVTASSYAAGATVTFSINPTLGTATAGANEVATLTAAIPSDTSLGDHQICAEGTDDTDPPAGLRLCANVTVVSPAPAPGPAPAPSPPVQQPLPATGSSSSVPLARIGILLVTAGGLVVLGARERRRKLARAAA
ncbi:MAG: LPXTG cell wall anchor domain-containing protein [Acidimicrobiales bacterium]